MNQKVVIISAALFILIVIGMFAFAHLKKGEIASPTNTADEQIEGEVEYASITLITAKHFYEDGVHTLVGELPMPTPCDLLEVESRVMESFPEQVVFDFNVVNNAEFCAQQVTPQRFKVSASASEEASLRATFMGRDVELNLVPPEPGETPEEFELYIKG